MILSRTGNPGKAGGTAFFESLAGFFEAPITQGMDLAGDGIVTKHLAAVIVGHRGLSRQEACRLAILPHVTNINHRLDVVLIPAAGHPLCVIIAPVPSENLCRREHQGMVLRSWLQQGLGFGNIGRGGFRHRPGDGQFIGGIHDQMPCVAKPCHDLRPDGAVVSLSAIVLFAIIGIPVPTPVGRRILRRAGRPGGEGFAVNRQTFTKVGQQILPGIDQTVKEGCNHGELIHDAAEKARIG